MYGYIGKTMMTSKYPPSAGLHGKNHVVTLIIIINVLVATLTCKKSD